MSIEIQILDNGPLRVTGANIVLKDAAGKPFNLQGKPGVALCRCGASQKKPFCDGGHAKAGFQSKIAAS